MTDLYKSLEKSLRASRKEHGKKNMLHLIEKKNAKKIIASPLDIEW